MADAFDPTKVSQCPGLVQLEQITRVSSECDVPVVPTVSVSPDLREAKLPLPVPPIDGGGTVITPESEMVLVKVCLTGEANTTWEGLGPDAGEWHDNQYSATITFQDGDETVDGALVTNINQSEDDSCQILQDPYKCYLGVVTGTVTFGETTVYTVDIAAEVVGEAFPAVLVKLTGHAEGGGIYTGTMYVGESGAVNDATGLSVETNPTGPTQLTCNVTVINLAENGLSTHIIACGEGVYPWLPGILIRNQDGTKVVAVYALETTRIIPVKVSNYAGDAGSDSTNCSFTYTVTDLNGVQLGTGVSPQRARWTNTTYLPAGTEGRSDWALAAWDGVTLTLLECYGEIQSNAPCET